MTDSERQHCQRLFRAWRETVGDFKMIFVRFDRPHPMHYGLMGNFVDFCAKQRGAKTGTLRPEVIAELRELAAKYDNRDNTDRRQPTANKER